MRIASGRRDGRRRARVFMLLARKAHILFLCCVTLARALPAYVRVKHHNEVVNCSDNRAKSIRHCRSTVAVSPPNGFTLHRAVTIMHRQFRKHFSSPEVDVSVNTFAQDNTKCTAFTAGSTARYQRPERIMALVCGRLGIVCPGAFEFSHSTITKRLFAGAEAHRYHLSMFVSAGDTAKLFISLLVAALLGVLVH